VRLTVSHWAVDSKRYRLFDMTGAETKDSKRISLFDLVFNFGSLIVYGATISPMLRSGFLADDRFDSLWASVRSRNGISALTDGLYWTQIYKDSLGRFHPLAHITGALFFEISSLSTAKTVSFFLTLVSVAVIAVGLNLWLNSRTIGGLFLVVLSAFSQFKPTFDPILSFGIHTKLLVIFAGGLFVSIAMIKRYAGLARGAAYISLNFFCLAMCLYHELAVAMLLSTLVLCRSLDRRDRKVSRANLLWWVGAYFSVRLFLYIAIDKSNTPPYYEVRLSALNLVRSYLVQLSGLVPFAELTHFTNLELVPNSFEVATGILAMFGFVYFLSRRKIEKELSCFLLHSTSSPISSLIYFGCVLVFFPPTLTSLSSGMQMWTKWWDGYLQVWIGEIGLAIVVAAILARHSKISIKGLQINIVPGLVLGILITFSGMANRNVVDNSPYWETDTIAMGWSRSVSENAVKSGILDGKYLTGEVLAVPPRPWLVDDYIKVLNQRSVRIQNQWQRFADSPSVRFGDCKTLEDKNSFKFSNCGTKVEYGLFVYARGFQDGFAILAQPISLTIPKDVSDQQLQVGEEVEIRTGYVFIEDDQGCRNVSAKAIDDFSVEVKLTRTGNQRLFRFRASEPFMASSLNTQSCLT